MMKNIGKVSSNASLCERTKSGTVARLGALFLYPESLKVTLEWLLPECWNSLSWRIFQVMTLITSTNRWWKKKQRLIRSQPRKILQQRHRIFQWCAYSLAYRFSRLYQWLKDTRATKRFANRTALKITDDELYENEASRGMGENEEPFDQEFQLYPADDPLMKGVKWFWILFLRLIGKRKPRYFNRVKTGVEWHNYNRAHYNKNNPPPKSTNRFEISFFLRLVIYGYAFNIFFPDLKDPTKIPTYIVHKTDDIDLNIIECTLYSSGWIFSCQVIASDPYQPIAFKIKHGDWEKSHRWGYRSRFADGCLQLHFKFKRYQYKR